MKIERERERESKATDCENCNSERSNKKTEIFPRKSNCKPERERERAKCLVDVRVPQRDSKLIETTKKLLQLVPHPRTSRRAKKHDVQQEEQHPIAAAAVKKQTV